MDVRVTMTMAMARIKGPVVPMIMRVIAVVMVVMTVMVVVAQT